MYKGKLSATNPFQHNESNTGFTQNESYFPSDFHLVQLFEKKRWKNKNVFHFGSGLQHIVSKVCENKNHVLAVTASAVEHNTYIQMLTENSKLSEYYKVLFTNIYTLSKNNLPMYDIVTLFHLGEFYNPQHSLITDSKLLSLFIKHVKIGGFLIFSNESCSYKRITHPLIKKKRSIEYVATFNTLEIYRKKG